MSAHSHPQPCCSTDKRLESTAAHSMVCTASAWNGLGLCSSRKIGEGRERGMEGGRKGSRQRRRVVKQLKMRCCPRGECSPFRCSSCRHATTHCELYFEAGVLLVHEGQDKLFCALHANSPQQGSGSVLLSCPVCPVQSVPVSMHCTALREDVAARLAPICFCVSRRSDSTAVLCN